jgi:hypothetical protein
VLSAEALAHATALRRRYSALVSATGWRRAAVAACKAAKLVTMARDGPTLAREDVVARGDASWHRWAVVEGTRATEARKQLHRADQKLLHVLLHAANAVKRVWARTAFASHARSLAAAATDRRLCACGQRVVIDGGVRGARGDGNGPCGSKGRGGLVGRGSHDRAAQARRRLKRQWLIY